MGPSLLLSRRPKGARDIADIDTAVLYDQFTPYVLVQLESGLVLGRDG